MRGELSKAAVQEIANHCVYARTSDICERALREDTSEGYRRALKSIVSGPNHNSEYAVSMDAARYALDNDR